MLMSLQVLCHHVFMETFKMDSHYVAVHKAYFPLWGGGGSEPPTLNHPSTTNHPRQEKVLCLVCTDFLAVTLLHRSCACVRSYQPILTYQPISTRINPYQPVAAAQYTQVPACFVTFSNNYIGHAKQ